MTITADTLMADGFVFEMRWPREYDLYVNKKTMQRARLYLDGSVWITKAGTGEYELVQRGEAKP